MHVITQRVCTLSDYELIFGASRVIQCVIGFKQGAAWHASVELAIWVAGRRRKDTVGTGLIVSERQGDKADIGRLCDSRAKTDNGACRYRAWARDWHKTGGLQHCS